MPASSASCARSSRPAPYPSCSAATTRLPSRTSAPAPGTGTPEPGGMTSGDLLSAVRAIGERLHLVGMDVVEVLPTGVGSADITALVAERTVREALTGIALRRRG